MSRARTFADLATASEAGSLSNRNLVINGDMAVAQRGTSTSSVTSSGYYACDRWKLLDNSDATLTISQATDLPSGQGFNNSFKIDVTTADSSVGAAQYAIVRQGFEGQFLQRLQKGFSTAKSSTVSFWVKSGLTGTHICRLYDHDNSRQISKSYTVNAADTWEHKTITFAGDTSTGDPLDDDNAQSMTLDFWLLAGSNYTSGSLQTTWADDTAANSAVGQVNVLGNASYNWLITGVQWELGEVATPFEHETFGDNLAKCQRYYYVHGEGSTDMLGTGVAEAAASSSWAAHFPTSMRQAPSLEVEEGTDYYQSFGGGTTDSFNGMLVDDTSPQSAYLYNNSGKGAGGNTAGKGIIVVTNNASSKVAFSSEL